MKKIFAALVLISLVMTNTSLPIKANENTTPRYKLNLRYNDIASLNFNIKSGQGRPLTVDESYLRKNFSYSTEDTDNIIYIVHFLNSFDFIDDGQFASSSDGTYVSINLKTTNELENKFSFADGRRLSIENKQYAVDKNEYQCFINFIYALKTEKIIIDDEITFEPSEWAEKDISKAVNIELVPELNQINYKGKISRLEVCQLVDNFLHKKGIIKTEYKENSFTDTDDESVVNLYNVGVIHGKTALEFKPYDYITREEFAKILSATYHMFDDLSTLKGSSIFYTDKEKISDWAFDSVNEVSSLKLFIGNDNGEFQPQNNITKEEVIITLLRLYDLIDSTVLAKSRCC